jgi:N-acetylglucosamine-6-sulfatase
MRNRPRSAVVVAIAVGLAVTLVVLVLARPPGAAPATNSTTARPQASAPAGQPTPTPSQPVGPRASASPGSKPPNIVILMLDDVPYLDPTTPWAAMPQMAATFLDHAVAFSDFHGETPLCCPGRAGFLTGQHTRNHGVNWNNAALLKPEMTIATALHGAGYYTFLAGKYLNLYDRIAPQVPPGWDGFHATEGSPLYYGYRIWNNGDPTPQTYGPGASAYSTDVLAGIATTEIAQAPVDKPIFGWIAVNAAHVPMTPPNRYRSAPCDALQPWRTANTWESDVSDKPAYIRDLPPGHGGFSLVRLCRPLLALDDAFAKIRDALLAAGRLDNTIFILSGDNGMAYGAHRLGYEKRTPYTTQLPFYVSWPAGLGTQPRSIDARLQNIDLAPTLCALAGCTLGPYPNGQAKPDGLSFATLLLGQGPAPDRDAVLSGYPEKKTKIPQWDAVTTTARSSLASEGCATAAEGGCRWHYVRYATGEHELYDDSGGPCWTWSVGQPGDPCELANRAGDPALATIQASLDQRLTQLITGTGP